MFRTTELVADSIKFIDRQIIAISFLLPRLFIEYKRRIDQPPPYSMFELYYYVNWYKRLLFVKWYFSETCEREENSCIMKTKQFFCLFSMLIVNCSPASYKNIRAKDVRKTIDKINENFAPYTKLYPFRSYYIRKYRNVVINLNSIGSNAVIQLPVEFVSEFRNTFRESKTTASTENLPKLVNSLRKLSNFISNQLKKGQLYHR